MYELEDLEQILEDKNIKIKELSIRNESLDRAGQKLLEELEVTSEQLTQLIESKENFTEENWKKLQNERGKLEEMLQAELNSIKNPRETEKVYEERKIDNHWLFVR